MGKTLYTEYLNRIPPAIRRPLSWLKNGLPKLLIAPFLSPKDKYLNEFRFYQGRRRTLNNLYFFPEQRLLYVEMPKAASSKILAAMMELASNQTSTDVHQTRASAYRYSAAHCTENQIYDMLTRDGIFRFTFVRNPFQRIYSAFKDKIKLTHSNTSDHNYEEYKKICRYLGKPFGYEVNFSNFVDYVCDQHDADMNIHWLPQVRVIWSNKITYDYIGRIESFERDFAHVFSQLHAPDSILAKAAERTNYTNKTIPIQNAYTQKMLDKIFERYKEDFDTFGYQKDSFN